MNKKQKTTAKLTAGGIGLVVLSALLTVGGIRLFSHEKGDKVLEKLLHIEFNADFFKNCKETSETRTQNYQVLTYEVPKTDYVIEISNYNPTETPFDFETSLTFNGGPALAQIRITNMDAMIIEFAGENAKKEVVETNRLLDVEESTLADGTKKTKSIYNHLAGDDLDGITKLQSFTIYGNKTETKK